jgi:hypothetical protein
VLFSAPHSVEHFRDGTAKLADRGTGGLALTLARNFGSWGVAQARENEGDANWDVSHPMKRFIATALSPEALVIDLHGMESQDVSDLDIGTGPVGLNDTPLIESLQRYSVARHIKVTVNERFDARRITTITGWAQSLGYSALQIEISSKFRPPLASREKLNDLISLLVQSLETRKS